MIYTNQKRYMVLLQVFWVHVKRKNVSDINTCTCRDKANGDLVLVLSIPGLNGEYLDSLDLELRGVDIGEASISTLGGYKRRKASMRSI